MKNRTRALKQQRIYDLLHDCYGDPGCPLVHASAWQLLAAVMLSAQCRDERVNEVTRTLFALYPGPGELANADLEEVTTILHPLGLYRNKAKNLLAAAQMVTKEYDGAVPRTMEQLLPLPGIGRKSANVILGNAFGIPGFPADTHVIRLLNRIFHMGTEDPVKLERIVNAEVPSERWTNYSHLLITHGRRVCHAAKPQCAACVLRSLCDSAQPVVSPEKKLKPARNIPEFR
ncbi:MAG: endonuclease III [Victivallaceae bacterium]|nr:endonuclease III [Victivallaceae bacterium]